MATYATPTAKAFRGHTLLRAVQFETIISHSVVLHPKMLHYSTVESDLLNSLAWDNFYILSSTVGYKISTMGYKISTMEYKLYPTVELSTMGYKLLYPIVDKKYPTLSY